MRWTILFLLMLIAPAISAAPTLTFQHEEIQPGETIFATIQTVGEFTQEIPESSISLYDGRRKISLEHDLMQYDGTYYLYIYATREGAFTIKIPNVLYKEADQLNSIDFEKNFSVSKEVIYSEDGNVSGTKILSIKPGHIFSINAPAIKLINQGTIPLELSYLENDTTLQPQETREVEFYPEETFSTFEVSSYRDFSAPVVYLSANGSILENKTEEIAALRASETFLTVNLIVGNETSEKIELFNFAEENLTDITLETDAPVEISEIETLQAKSAENITLTFTPDQVGHIQENLTIKYKMGEKEENMTIILSLYVLPEGSSEEDFIIINETCADKNGQVCAPGFLCSGDTLLTSNNEYCCVGTCEEIEDPSKKDSGLSGGWIWGIVILVVLAGVGYYFYRKSRKIKKPTSDEKLEETSKKYTERLSGKLQRN